jgi:hypothetical protein
LAGWRDPQGTLLATGLVLQVNGTTQPSNWIYTGYTVNGDSATVDCTGGLAGVNVPARFTFRGQTRIWGVPYQGVSWQLTIDGAPVDGAPPLGNVTIGLTSLNYDGSVYGFQYYHMDPVWDGLSQYNMSNALSTVGASDDNQTFSLVMHPQGAYVAYIPNFSEGWENFTGFATVPRPGTGFSLVKHFTPSEGGARTFATPTFNFLFAPQAAVRGTAQAWLDARFGTFREQWRSVGLGIQHLHVLQGGSCGGPSDWSHWQNLDAWYRNIGSPLYWNALDCDRQFMHTGMFLAARSGPPSNATHTDGLEAPDLYLPNASDLPAVIPGVTLPGQPPLQPPVGPNFTQGTMDDLVQNLNVQRLLGLRPGIWSRDYFAGCVGGTENPSNTTQWSRWDKGWSCSYLWKARPEWGAELPNGQRDPAPQAYPNFSNPEYVQYYKDFHKYWLDLGLLGFFKDTGCFPCNGLNWYQGRQIGEARNRWDVMRYLLQQGAAYIVGEQPLLFSYTIADHTGNPKFQKYEEWVYTFASHNWAEVTGGWFVHVDRDMAWDPAAADRTMSVVGVHGCCTQSVVDVSGPKATEEARASYLHYNSLLQRYGVPDRVELIGARPGPHSTYLESAMPAGVTEMNTHNPQVLPFGTVVQIENERIFVGDRTQQDWCDTTRAPRCQKLLNVVRGWDSTPVSAHPAMATITPLDDGQHWEWDDAYWVYGPPDQEIWIKFSDGSVWQQGGTQAARLPQISNVQVNGATVSWDTDIPTTGWVEYDTFGRAEQFNNRRNPAYWPAYHWRSNLQEVDPPPDATQHSVVLDRLVSGALTHYRIVARGPAQAVTADATFTAP